MVTQEKVDEMRSKALYGFENEAERSRGMFLHLFEF